MQIPAHCQAHLSAYTYRMRRKPGALVPLEADICMCAAELLKSGTDEFHGYDLAKQIAMLSGRESLAAHGTLYRALSRLVDMGLLTSRWEDPDAAARENRPRRRFYALTRSGRTAAREAMDAIAQQQLRKRARKGWAPA
jgi:PadR family transcriptional regulator PadR